jgi:hypothetical protein
MGWCRSGQPAFVVQYAQVYEPLDYVKSEKLFIYASSWYLIKKDLRLNRWKFLLLVQVVLYKSQNLCGSGLVSM